MVARRAAQGEGGSGAAGDGLLAGESDLRRAPGRLPGAGRDRRAAVETVVAELAVQVFRQHAAQGARGPGEGQQVAVVAQRGPARPGTFEEAQVALLVYAFDGRTAEILWPDHLAQLALLHALQHVVGPRRHFEAGLELPVDDFATAVVQMMVVAVDRQHGVLLAGDVHIFHQEKQARNGSNGQKGIDVATKPW